MAKFLAGFLVGCFFVGAIYYAIYGYPKGEDYYYMVGYDNGYYDCRLAVEKVISSSKIRRNDYPEKQEDSVSYFDNVPTVHYIWLDDSLDNK